MEQGKASTGDRSVLKAARRTDRHTPRKQHRTELTRPDHHRKRNRKTLEQDNNRDRKKKTKTKEDTETDTQNTERTEHQQHPHTTKPNSPNISYAADGIDKNRKNDHVVKSSIGQKVFSLIRGTTRSITRKLLATSTRDGKTTTKRTQRNSSLLRSQKDRTGGTAAADANRGRDDEANRGRNDENNNDKNTTKRTQRNSSLLRSQKDRTGGTAAADANRARDDEANRGRNDENNNDKNTTKRTQRNSSLLRSQKDRTGGTAAADANRARDDEANRGRNDENNNDKNTTKRTQRNSSLLRSQKDRTGGTAAADANRGRDNEANRGRNDENNNNKNTTKRTQRNSSLLRSQKDRTEGTAAAESNRVRNDETNDTPSMTDDDFADLAMCTDVDEKLDEPEEDYEMHEVSGVQESHDVSSVKESEDEQLRLAREQTRDSILQTFTDPPILIATTAENLRIYLSELASSGGALVLNEKVESYCKTERITTEPLSQILTEMEKAQLLNSTGRNLLAVTDQNPQQRWKDFLRALVNTTKGNRAHRKASTVIEGLNRTKMATALCYAMSTPLGLKIATDAQQHLTAKGPTDRTLIGMFKTAVFSEGILAELATVLLRWNRSRQPLPSFQEWLKRVVLERRKEDENNASKIDTNASPLCNVIEEMEQRQDEETEQYTGDTNIHDHSHIYTGFNTRKRLVTLNLNSLVKALERPEGRLLSLIDRNRADVWAFQETMVDTALVMKGSKWKISPFMRAVKAMGYWAYWHSGTRSKGGYGGTLFLTLVEPECVIEGTGNKEVDSEGRFQALVFADAIMVNTYCPTLSLELDGKQRKTDFWTSATERYLRITNKFRGRKTIWMGDMNVAPYMKDAAADGIRRQLERKSPRTAARLQRELPSQTEHERQELQEFQKHLGLVDAFEYQTNHEMGRDSKGRQRFTQYGHGNRKLGFGQRVDLILTNAQMAPSTPNEPTVISVRVLTGEEGSDHLPVEMTIDFPTLQPNEGTGSPQLRAMGGSKAPPRVVPTITPITYEVGDRVLVNREQLTSVAASEERQWVPSTVKEVHGRLVKIRTDPHWLHRNARQEQGVTACGIKPLPNGKCPTRYILGEEIMHYRSRKPGTIKSIKLGDGNAKDHIYGVRYQGTVDSKMCGNASIRPPKAPTSKPAAGELKNTTNELRSPPASEILTSAKLTHKGVFKMIATCMAGMESTTRPRPMAAWADQHDYNVNDLEVCTCNHETVATLKTQDLPSVPHTNQILLNGKNPYALLDTGAAPNLVRTEWLKMAWPEYWRKLDQRGAATTKFKLADGGNSASPDGTINLSLTVNGAPVNGIFWVLKQLTTDMIVGTAMMDELGMNVDYATRSMTSAARPDIGRINFDLKGTPKWRQDTSVTTRRDIVLLPNTMHMVEGHIEYHELTNAHSRRLSIRRSPPNPVHG